MGLHTRFLIFFIHTRAFNHNAVKVSFSVQNLRPQSVQSIPTPHFMPQLPAVINCTTKAESLWRISYEFSPSLTNQAFIRHDFPRHPVGQLAACHHPTQPLLFPAESDRNSDPSTARNLDGKKIKGGTVPEHSTIDTMPYEPLPLGLKTINAPAQLDSSSTSTLPAYFLGGGEWLGGR